MKIDRNFKIFILVVLIAILGVGFFGMKSQFQLDKHNSSSQEDTLSISKEVSLIIDSGENSPKTYKEEVGGEVSVFELMKEAGIKMEYMEYPEGILIDSIGGLANGEIEGKYWIYYINEEQAKVGVDNYLVKAGDEIKWNYEKPNW